MQNLPLSQTWLILPIEPPESTHQANLRVLKTKTGRLFVGKMRNNKATKWVNEFRGQILAHRAVPEKPIEGPIRVYIRFYYTPPKYLLKKINNCKILVKTTKPDVDNVVKVILDEMTRLKFWIDDNQVWALSVEKYWSVRPRVELYIDQNQQPTTNE